jgi:hypothetical protein
MKTAEIISFVHAHRGHIMVGMLARNDVKYVRVVKSDLLDVLKNTDDDELTWVIKDGIGYVDNAC